MTDDEIRERASALQVAVAQALSPLFGDKLMVGVSLVALVHTEGDHAAPFGMVLGVSPRACEAVRQAAQEIGLGTNSGPPDEEFVVPFPEKH